MYEFACFRVSADEVASDFKKFAELARTRTFEIFDEGKVEVLLVRVDAVREWHDKLRISIPAALMTDEEVKRIRASQPTEEEIRTNRWNDGRPSLPD